MNLLLSLLCLACAAGWKEGILRKREGKYVLEVDDDPFFYKLNEDGILPAIITSEIDGLGLLGKYVKVTGTVHKAFIKVKELEEKYLRAKHEARSVSRGNKITLGEATGLVVIVGGKGVWPKGSRDTISNKFFGLGDDRLNVNILEKCSFGKFKIIPYEGESNGQQIKGGIIEVELDYKYTGANTDRVVTDALLMVKKKYGKAHIDGVDHTFFYLHEGSISDGDAEWLAYGDAPGWTSVYNGHWLFNPTTVAHEVGHNLDLEHARDPFQNDGNLKDYGDWSGIMGAGEDNDDGPDSCFNGPNNWWLDWFDDRTDVYRSGEGTKIYDVYGIADYDKTPESAVVVLKVGVHTYVSFNRATGINKGVKEFRDMVIIHTWEGVDEKTIFKKTLTKTGDSHKCDDGSDMVITLNSLNLNASPAYAEITVTSSGAQNNAKWIPVENKPMKGCTISDDGLCVEVAEYDNEEVCYIEAGSDGKLMFHGDQFNIATHLNIYEWQFDKLFIGSRRVITNEDLPENIKEGDFLVWTTDEGRNGKGWTLCMSPTGEDEKDLCPNPDPCAAKTTQCQARSFCWMGECRSTPKKDGTDCDDGNPNTVEDQCTAGVCQGIDKCAGRDCPPNNDCEIEGVCDINTGECIPKFADAGKDCDDTKDHTVNDVCDGSGTCNGVENMCEKLPVNPWFWGGLENINPKCNDLPASMLRCDNPLALKTCASTCGTCQGNPRQDFITKALQKGAKLDCKLNKVAQDMAKWGAEIKYFDFPEGERPWTEMNKRYNDGWSSTGLRGDGLGLSRKSDPKGFFRNWGLNFPNFKAFGIGIYADENGLYYGFLYLGFADDVSDSSCIALPSDKPEPPKKVEEKDACINNPCGENAICTDLPGGVDDASGRECECQAGFNGNAEAGCTEIDACINNPCGNNAVCSDLIGGKDSALGRKCECKPGFQEDSNGLCVRVEIDACINNPCGNNAVCSDLIGREDSPSGRKCECKPGFEKDGRGKCVAVRKKVPEKASYENLGNGICTASDGKFTGLYWYTEGPIEPSECERVCSSNPECLGYDVPNLIIGWIQRLTKSSPGCRLNVSSKKGFAKGTPSGFIYEQNIGGGTEIGGFYNTGWKAQIVGCMRKLEGSEAEELVSLFEESPETPQTYSEMLSTSIFPSLQFILATIGALGLIYKAFNLCVVHKNAYNPVPEEV